MSQEIINKAGEIISKRTSHQNLAGGELYCGLALIDENGYPTISTITAAKSKGISDVTFCSGLYSNKAQRIKKCNRASVCFNSPEYNITLVGIIEIVSDPAIKKEMWYDGLEQHLSGPEDPEYCVLHFKTERYKLFIDWQEAEGRL